MLRIERIVVPRMTGPTILKDHPELSFGTISPYYSRRGALPFYRLINYLIIHSYYTLLYYGRGIGYHSDSSLADSVRLNAQGPYPL